jgi:hypothetical protein
MDAVERATLLVKLTTSNSRDQWDTWTEIVWRPPILAGPIIQTLKCDSKRLCKLRHELAQAYDDVHSSLPTEELIIIRGRLRIALMEAHRIGRALFNTAADREQARAICELLRVVPMEMQIEGEANAMFALDMLPLGWLTLDELSFRRFLDERQQLRVEEVASMLPCWQWPVIRRWTNHRLPLPTLLPRSGRSRVAYIGDDALGKRHGGTVNDGLSEVMRDSHSRTKVHPDLTDYEFEHHWPDEPPMEKDEIIRGLARHLVNPCHMPRGCHHPDRPAVITHFFCHGDTTIEEPADRAGRVAARRGAEFTLSIGQRGKKDVHHEISGHELGREMELQRQSISAPQRQRTLILMSACAGALQDQRDNRAILSVFAENQHPVVIGTEATMDHQTAHELAIAFYCELRRGFAAHVALWRAQRLLAAESAGRSAMPAALLYSCYGIPECRLEPISGSEPYPQQPTLITDDLFLPPKTQNFTTPP